MAIITCLPHKQSHSLSLTLLHVFSLRTLQAVQVDLIPSWFGPSSQDPNATSNLTLQQGTFNVSLFNAWIFGNIVEAVQTISMQRKADALKYVQTHPLVMFYLLVDMLLLSLGVVYTGYVNEVRKQSVGNYNGELDMGGSLLWPQARALSPSCFRMRVLAERSCHVCMSRCSPQCPRSIS